MVAARRLSLGLLALSLGASLLAGGASARSFVDVKNFDVQLTGASGFGGAELGERPSCQSAGDALVCSLLISHSENGVAMSGTVTAKAEALSGSISTTCDMTFNQTVRLQVSGASVTLLQFSGGGTQTCSWYMSFSEGSTMSGTFAGTMEMGKVSDTSVYERGRMTVTVVAGTGRFADQIGTGSFDEYNEVPLGGLGLGTAVEDAAPSTTQPPATCFDPSGNPAPCPVETVAIVRMLSAVSAKPASRMRLVLRAGKPLARIVAPRTVKRSSDALLRVVSAPGSTCSALARSGAKRISLGGARDLKGHGEVVFPGRFASKLAAGAWQVQTSCSFSGGSAADAAALVVS